MSSSCNCGTEGCSSKLNELRLLEAYLNCMALDIPMLNAAKSEREWDWFFHKLEEGFMVAEVDEEQMKMKLAKRFMRGRQLFVWCDLMSESHGDSYETIRDKMYFSFFPQSDYYNSLMELFGGFRENGNESPRRKMSLVGVKLVIGTAKETMTRVAMRYSREMPPETFWYQFAVRLMTPNVKELFDAKMTEILPGACVPVQDPTSESSGAEDVKVTCPDMPIEQMLNLIKDPNARSMRAPHKFRRTIRKNRMHQNPTTKGGKLTSPAAPKALASSTGGAPSPMLAGVEN